MQHAPLRIDCWRSPHSRSRGTPQQRADPNSLPSAPPRPRWCTSSKSACHWQRPRPPHSHGICSMGSSGCPPAIPPARILARTSVPGTIEAPGDRRARMVIDLDLPLDGGLGLQPPVSAARLRGEGPHVAFGCSHVQTSLVHDRLSRAGRGAGESKRHFNLSRGISAFVSPAAAAP